MIRGTLSLYGIFSIGKRHVPFDAVLEGNSWQGGKVKRAIRGILADYEKEECDIIYLESKTIVSLSI